MRLIDAALRGGGGASGAAGNRELVVLVDDVAHPMRALLSRVARESVVQPAMVLRVEPKAAERAAEIGATATSAIEVGVPLDGCEIGKKVEAAAVSSGARLLLVDSFSGLFARLGADVLVFRLLQSWMRLFERVVLLHHSDVVSAATTAQLIGLANTSFVVDDDDINPTRLLVLPPPTLSTGPLTFGVRMRTQAPGARMQIECALMAIDRQSSLVSFSSLEKASSSLSVLSASTTSSTSVATASSSTVAAPDPTASLPFNLSLTDSQRAARSQVVLPYLQAQNASTAAGGGTIEYDPSEDLDSDADAEDPDDDLDF